MHASKNFAPLLKSAPPYAQRSGFRASWQNRRAYFRGLRDSGSDPGPEGFAAALCLFRQVDQIAARIHGEVQQSIFAIDMQILQLEESVTAAEAREAALRSKADSPAEVPTVDSESNGHHALPSQLHNDANRMAKATAATRGQIKVLRGQRDHIHEAAGALLDSWAARANELAAHHARGHRHGRSASVTESHDPARYTMPDYAWAQDKQQRLISEDESDPNEEEAPVGSPV